MSAYFYNRFQKNELAKVAFTSIATKPRRKTVAKFADEMYGSVEDYEETERELPPFRKPENKSLAPKIKSVETPFR